MVSPVTDSSLAHQISSRAAVAGLKVNAHVVDGCVSYVALLAKWTRTINLTALPLTDPVPDSSIDKLVVEPLVAAAMFPSGEPAWIDLGSGGGSPAIPMRIARPAGSLCMVESRERKCTFLRELVRTLRLKRTEARAVRFEDLGSSRVADLITLRAVRVDDVFSNVLDGLLATDGLILSFGSPVLDARFRTEVERLLPDGSTLFLIRRADI